MTVRRHALSWTRALVDWFEADHRYMPWRSRPTPYRVWVSEIMLQQTQVVTVIPYFRRFMKRFPSVRALARARVDDVLRQWQGLGYYTRARNLLVAARRIVERHGGVLPDSYEGWRTLPGIGDYTAAAIASICHDERVPTVDGNVLRVFARFRLVRGGIDQPRVRSEIRAALEREMPPDRAGDFNQAMMELGALVCRPGRPLCERCPIRRWCGARRTDRTDEFPRRGRRVKAIVRRFDAVVLHRQDRVLLVRPGPGEMLAGLWNVPQWERTGPGGRMRQALPGISLESRGLVEHAYTHFRAHVRVWEGSVPGTFPAPGGRCYRWVMRSRLSRYPLSRLAEKILSQGAPS